MGTTLLAIRKAKRLEGSIMDSPPLAPSTSAVWLQNTSSLWSLEMPQGVQKQLRLWHYNKPQPHVLDNL